MALMFTQSLKLLFNYKIIFNRKITMSAQLRAEKVLEELKNKNPYFDKYASKIAALQQTSPEEFLERAENIDKKRSTPKLEKPRDYLELLRPKSDVKIEKNEKLLHKKLDDVMKVELLGDKTADELQNIWLEYHKQKDVITATITSEIYDMQMKRGKEYPLFIVPLPRSQGFEFFLLQFSVNSIHFTPLLCYQVHKENAPECLNMIYYTEFRDKNIILMKGEYDSNVINAQEAQCLANQLQLYYAQNDSKKLELLEKFTKSPDTFKHMDVIHELENIKIAL